MKKIAIIFLILSGLIFYRVNHQSKDTSPWCEQGQTVNLPSCNLCEYSTTPDLYDENLPPLVMINGIPTTSAIYEPLVGELKKTVPNRLIRLDLPGTGESSIKAEFSEYNWTLQRQCFTEYLTKPFDDGRSRQNIIPVLHDIAGPIFIPLLKDFRLIPKVVILNTIIDPTQFRPPGLMRLIAQPALGKLSIKLTPASIYKWAYAHDGFGLPDKVSSQQMDNIYNRFLAHDGDLRLYHIMQGFELNLETREAIKSALEVSRRQLIIFSDKDGGLSRQQEYIPKTRGQDRQIVKDGRHFFMMDYTSELAARIRVWLTKPENL